MHTINININCKLGCSSTNVLSFKPCSLWGQERPRINVTRHTNHEPRPRLADHSRPALARGRGMLGRTWSNCWVRWLMAWEWWLVQTARKGDRDREREEWVTIYYAVLFTLHQEREWDREREIVQWVVDPFFPFSVPDLCPGDAF